MKGSEFALRYAAASVKEREAAAFDLVKAGSFVQWPWRDVYSKSGPFHGTIRVASDYFAIGDAEDFIRLPMTPILAQRIADFFGWSLPTKKIVGLVWNQAEIRLEPIPTMPDAAMRSLGRYAHHNALIQAALAELQSVTPQDRAIVAGHKKDIVLTNKLEAGRVAIYGWHRSSGTPIQGLNATSHSSAYEDYSHGVRFVRGDVVINGTEMRLADLFAASDMCGLVSDEGVLCVTRQPGTNAKTAAEEKVMKRGDKGSNVADWQTFLNERGFYDAAGHTLAVDGVFGTRTEQATKRFQEVHGIVQTGIASAATIAMAEKVSETPPPPPTDPSRVDDSLPAIKFIQARNYTKLSTPRKIDLIVIHTMEAPEKPTTAENVAAWFAGPSAPRASAHYCLDSDSVVQTVREEDVAWHAPGANRNGIGIEHAGFAKQTPADWADEFSTAMLAQSAQLVAEICKRYDIPVTRLTPADLKNKKRGICGHVDCTNAFSDGVGHWDPGPSYPWASYLAQIREALAKLG